MIDKARQVSDVIDVRMGDDTSIDGSSVERRLLPITIPQIVTALKQATVNEYARAIGFDQVSRAGDCSGSAPE